MTKLIIVNNSFMYLGYFYGDMTDNILTIITAFNIFKYVVTQVNLLGQDSVYFGQIIVGDRNRNSIFVGTSERHKTFSNRIGVNETCLPIDIEFEKYDEALSFCNLIKKYYICKP